MPRDEKPNGQYTAFLSYSRSATKELANDLHSAVERFGKKWYQLRATRVFRDDNSMAANASLWGAIESALRSSDWFVLIAHPASAASEYVKREIDWWLKHKGSPSAPATDRILIILAGGDIVWNGDLRAFDSAGSTALPEVLAGAYVDEPRWVDMRWYNGSTGGDPRFLDAVADIAAAVRELPKEELVGENVRQHQRTRNVVRGTIATLTALVLLTASAAGVAFAERNRAERNATMAELNATIAEENATVAEARYLAIRSGQVLDTDSNAARQLAAHAYLRDETSATESALFTSLLGSGQIDRTASFTSAVRAVAGTSDGSKMVVGLEDGSVALVDPSGAISVLATMGGTVTEVGIDDSGTLVTATAASFDGVYTAEGGAWDSSGAAVELPVDGDVSFVRVLPAGGHVLVGLTSGTAFSGGGAALVDLSTRTSRVLEAGNVPISDAEVLAVDDSGWSVIDAATGAVLRTESYGFGSRNALLESPTGGHVALMGGASAVPVWSTTEGDGYDQSAACPVGNASCDLWPWVGSFPDGFARGPAGGEFVISDNGDRLAWSDGSAVSVSFVVAPEEIDRLDEGLARVDGVGMPTALAFAGSDLLVGTADGLLRIDLDAASPVRRTINTDVSTACTACTITDVSLSPDGRRLAKGGWGQGLTVRDMTTGIAARIEGQDLHPIAWLDESTLIVIDLEAGTAQKITAGEALHVALEVTLPRLDNLSAGGGIAGGALGTDGKVRFLTEAGQVWTLNRDSLEPEAPLTLEEIAGELGSTNPPIEFSPSGTFAVTRTHLVDLVTGEGQRVVEDSDVLLTINSTGPVVLGRDAIEQYDNDLNLVSSVGVSPHRTFTASADPTGRWLTTVELGGETATVRSMADGVALATIPLQASTGGTARFLFEADGDAVLLHTASPEASATADTLVLDPQSWIDAVCNSPDFVPLAATQWTTLTQMDFPTVELCADVE